ncbi:MAG: leucine-rich repeat domain-containing protein [Bacillales bacterium]|jgi:hypothetical protein|nr:leucine-rich repeat domain-containing protein [Bacillales bacterium]
MRKIIKGLMVVIGLIGLVGCNTTNKNLTFSYLADSDSYEITGHLKDFNKLVIPSTYQNKPVTSIKGGAFSYCWSLKSITIPKSITNIGYHAFSSSLITNIKLDPANSVYNLLTLGEGKVVTTTTTWENDTIVVGGLAYGNIVIPENITSIAEQAFFWCGSITGITIPSGVTSIGWRTFANCDSLKSIDIPNSVTSIGQSAFAGCSSLTSVIIPDSVEYIGDYAFVLCSSLTNIVIPSGVTDIGLDAFSYCRSITNITLDPTNPTYHLLTLGSGKVVTTSTVWDNNSEVVGGLIYGNITIPNSVTFIDDEAFSGYVSITSIVIPDSVTSIGDGAFSNCSSLTSIIISNSVINIGRSVFIMCLSLTIYCEALSKPAGWDVSWNSDRPVVWGYTA